MEQVRLMERKEFVKHVMGIKLFNNNTEQET